MGSLNYVPVLVAATVSFVFGGIWYHVFSKQWLEAVGRSPDNLYMGKSSIGLYLLAFGSQLVMAWMLAGVLGHLGPGQVTLRNGIISGVFLWFGFVLTTMTVNNAFSGRKYTLTAINAGHWLAVLVVMGAIVGGMGLK